MSTSDISATTAGASITTLTGAGSVVPGSQRLTLTDASLTFAGEIGGTGGFTIANGNETLTGTNTFGGTTEIDATGQLNLSATAHLGDRVSAFAEMAGSCA